MNKQILIVEDEIALSDAYEMILKHEGYDVAVAHDGQEALLSTAASNPDLILLDLRMPRMSGIEFLRAYEAKKNHPNTRIIVFSNLDTKHEIDKAYALGATKYILKAWASPKELIKLVKDELLLQSQSKE